MKRVTLLLILWLAGILALAQPPMVQWQTVLGGSSNEIAGRILATTDGGCLLVSTANSMDGVVVGNHGQSDCWLVKLDPNGGVEWSRCYGGSGAESGVAVVSADDGGFVVAASSNSNNGDVEENNGSYDLWIFKVDASGNLVWQTSLGGSAEDQAKFIVNASDGGYLVGGYSASANGDITGNYGALDAWVVKLDTTGNLLWQATYGGSFSESAENALVTSDGGYLITGDSGSNDGDVTGSHGGMDAWVIKLDDGGALQWQRALGGSSIDLALSATETNTGNYLIAAMTGSVDGDITDPNGSWDAWILELDTNGSLLSQRSLGGSAMDEGIGVWERADGGMLVTARTASNDGDVTGANGSFDYWVIRLGPSGETLWQLLLGGSDQDDLRSTAVAVDGGLLLFGNSRSSNGNVSANNGGYDLWVVKLQAEAVGMSEQFPTPITICPNPTTGSVRIETPNLLPGQPLQLSNAHGKVVMRTRATGTSTTLDLGRLASGTYVLQVGTDSSIGTRCLVLERP